MVSGIYEGVLQCITFWAGVLYSTISEVKIPIMQMQTDCICGQQNTPPEYPQCIFSQAAPQYSLKMVKEDYTE